jgi:RNA polymerase sigma factor (sigma-70 family)
MTQPAVEGALPVRERRPAERGRVVGVPSADERFEVLFRRHYAGLLRLAVVMVGDREAAEDVVQEAFVSLHRHLRGLRDPEAAEAYLRSAVLNRSRSWVRRQATQRAARPLLLVRDVQESAEQSVVDSAQTGAVVAVLRTLARRQREVLACRFVMELSVEETARLLEMSTGSVKTHTHRGLQALQKRIGVSR